MLRNITRGVVISVVCLVALQSQLGFARGVGHPGGPGGAGHGSNSHAPAFGSFAPHRPGENGVRSPAWYGGLGYAGYGYGGYGYEYPAWGWPYDIDHNTDGVPYFSVFPPVYYDYDNGAIAPRSTLLSTWIGYDAVPAVAEASPAPTPEPQPLRIVNPYYTEGKSDKP